LRRNGAGDPSGAAPRSLKQLLKQVDKATQVRRSGLEQVLVELNLHRDSTPSPELQSALAWLCNSLSRMVNDPNAAHSREVLVAADAVKRASA
jgi:siroheme synthase (precorrin-2 oxidase/ferrochelatase)